MATRRPTFSTEEVLDEIFRDSDSENELDEDSDDDPIADLERLPLDDEGDSDNLHDNLDNVADDNNHDDDAGAQNGADGGAHGDDGAQNDRPQPPPRIDPHTGAYRNEPWMGDFDDNNSGPKLQDATKTPGEIFLDILDDNIIGKLVTETNRYARQFFDSIGGQHLANSMLRKWTDICANTMRAFIAIIMYMGMVKLPAMRMHWSNNFLLRLGIKKVMARDDFFNILRFLHCSDNDQAIPRGQVGYNRLNKIGDLVGMFVANWQKYFYPSREISVDECIIAFKGRSYLKMYHPKKPHKWGMCVWSVCDAKTGYSYGWKIYCGKDAANPPSANGATYDVVMNILNDNNLLDKYHHVYMDNFFTSPKLFKDLSDRSTGACGTLRANCTGTPVIIKNAKPKKNEPAVFAKDGRLQYAVWQDKKKVTVCSSVHNDKTFEKTVKDKNSPNHQRQCQKPNCIELYTKYMRGVDMADQQMWYSMFTHKSLKWWKKILFALIEVSFVNTCIIWRKLHPGEQFDRNEFRLDIITDLLMGYDRKSQRPGRRSGGDPPARLVARHFLRRTQDLQVNGRRCLRQCIVCEPKRPNGGDDAPPSKFRCRTTHKCIECDEYMCEWPCFKRYHTLVNYRLKCDDELHDKA